MKPTFALLICTATLVSLAVTHELYSSFKPPRGATPEPTLAKSVWTRQVTEITDVTDDDVMVLRNLIESYTNMLEELRADYDRYTKFIKPSKSHTVTVATLQSALPQFKDLASSLDSSYAHLKEIFDRLRGIHDAGPAYWLSPA